MRVSSCCFIILGFAGAPFALGEFNMCCQQGKDDIAYLNKGILQKDYICSQNYPVNLSPAPNVALTIVVTLTPGSGSNLLQAFQLSRRPLYYNTFYQPSSSA